METLHETGDGSNYVIIAVSTVYRIQRLCK